MANLAARLLAGVPALLFRSHFRVRGNSMTPALRDGDLLHVIPRSLRDGPLDRGAVVVARPPSPSFNGDCWVKRVIGLPGEFIAVGDDGSVRIDDAPLPEAYRSGGASGGCCPAAQSQSPAEVSGWLCDADEYFLMGDNRAESSDSRRYGPVHRSAIIGRVWLRWPARRSRQTLRQSRAR